MIVVKLWNANSMINHKFAEEHKMIAKARENFDKNKRIINICNDFFQKICCLSVIETKNDHNLKSRSFKFLKLSALIFFLLIKFIKFLVVRFSTFVFISIKFIKFLVTRSYTLVWIMKFIKYNNVFELNVMSQWSWTRNVKSLILAYLDIAEFSFSEFSSENFTV